MNRREIRRALALGGREQRFVGRASVRAAAVEDGGSPRFEGHAVVYDEWTTIADWWYGDYRERISAGAFTESMAQDDIRFLVNHDPNMVLARRRGDPQDTLELNDDSTGLLVRADLDTRLSYAADLAVSLERGDVSGMSFGFSDVKDVWRDGEDGVLERTIVSARLWDVSAVTYPAYDATDAGLRQALHVPSREAIRELVTKRAGRRNSASDEAVLRAAADECRAIAEDLDGLLETREEDDEDARAARVALAEQAQRHQLFAAKFGLRKRPEEAKV